MKQIFNKYLPLLVFAAAILQVAVPAFIINQGFFNQDASPVLFIQPSGATFAIWGLIYLFASIYALYQVFPQNDNAILQKNRIYALILFLGSSLWLYASNLLMEWLWVTVPILVVMAWAGYRAVEAQRVRQHDTADLVSFMSYGSLIIYAAWVNIAQFVNIGSMLTTYDLFNPGSTWLGINIVLFVVVFMWLWVQFKSLRYSVWYAGVVLWALYGVATVNMQSSGEDLFIYMAAFAALPFIYGLGKRILHLW